MLHYSQLIDVLEIDDLTRIFQSCNNIAYCNPLMYLSNALFV